MVWGGDRSDKHLRPCAHYSGNMCGGFGGKTICHWCGWDMTYHGWDEDVLVQAFPGIPRMGTPCRNCRMAYRDHVLIGGGCFNFEPDWELPLIEEPTPPIPENIILGED